MSFPTSGTITQKKTTQNDLKWQIIEITGSPIDMIIKVSIK